MYQNMCIYNWSFKQRFKEKKKKLILVDISSICITDLLYLRLQNIETVCYHGNAMWSTWIYRKTIYTTIHWPDLLGPAGDTNLQFAEIKLIEFSASISGNQSQSKSSCPSEADPISQLIVDSDLTSWPHMFIYFCSSWDAEVCWECEKKTKNDYI